MAVSSLLSVLLATAPCPVRAAELTGPETGLPLPRFVSLRAKEANIRIGPGVQYPVDWVYVRRFMPLEITAEFDNWRKIRDWEGTEGWVHKSMLSGRRTALITGENRTIRQNPATLAPPVAHAEPGVIGALLECETDWCRIDVKGNKGWLPRMAFWGIYPGERLE